MVSALDTASRNRPPLTDRWCSPASFIAERTVIGIESFRAHEKSTISTASAFVTFRVISQMSAVAPRLYGTSLSARCAARSSVADLSFSDSSIMRTIRS